MHTQAAAAAADAHLEHGGGGPGGLEDGPEDARSGPDGLDREGEADLGVVELHRQRTERQCQYVSAVPYHTELIWSCKADGMVVMMMKLRTSGC